MILIFIVCIILIRSSDELYYETNRLDKWPIEYNTCAGKVQSPIDIQDWEANYNKLLTDFNFINYEKLVNW